jgi:hypothetical protein
MSKQYISNVCVPEIVVACDVHRTEQWNEVVACDAHRTEQRNEVVALGLLNYVLTVGFGDASSVASCKCLISTEDIQ